jgi:hypothetical protein
MSHDRWDIAECYLPDPEPPWSEKDHEEESQDEAAERYTAEHGEPESTF